MKYEIYFYKDEMSMAIEQAKRAFELGAGNDWKVIKSCEVKDVANWSVLNDLGIVAPPGTTKVVVIQNNMS